MAENLGEAQLLITVNAQQALQQLAAFQAQVAQSLGNAGTIRFEGVEQQARAAGQRAGRAVADGVRQSTQGLRFGNLQEALDFSGALNGTLRDLRQYRDAVVALRDTTAATAPEFATLNDVVVACNAAIRNFSTGSDALADALDRVRAREAADQLRAYQQGVREAAAADREWEGALRTIVGAQRDAARASREVEAANRAQLQSFLDLAKGAASATAKGIGGVAKGVTGAVKGAVNLGKGAYDIGAEFGIFEAPRTGPIKEAINQVIERFKFLGEQATTTRGMVLRSIEAIGASGVLSGVAANADTLRAALNGLSVTSRTAEGALSWLANFGQGFANLTSNIPIVGDLAQLAANGEKAAAVTSTLGDFLTQLGVSAGGVALNSIEALVNAVSSIPPEAQAAVLALGGLSLAFKDKPIIEGLTRVTEYLEGLKSQTLSVSQGLQSMLDFASRIETPALPAYQERGLQRLDMQFANAGGSAPGPEAVARITDDITGNVKEIKAEAAAVDAQWERGTRYLEKLNAEMQRLVEQGLELKQIGIGPSGMVPQQTNQLPPGAPATSRPNPNQYSTPVEPSAQEAQRALLEEDLAQIQAQRVQQQERADALHEQSLRRQKRNLEEQTKEIGRGREIGRLNAVAIDGKLPGGGFAPGSPGALGARNKRVKDAVGSALIGGAFPLLFGQGIGAAAGGGVGGAAGGLLGGQFGFGLSLVGTALGTQFDEALKKGQALADALRDPIGQLGALSEAALLSSKQVERSAKSLVESGRTAEAAALVRQDLITQYGSSDRARELGEATDELGRSWTQLSVTLAQVAAGPLSKVAQLFTGLLGGGGGSSDRVGNLSYLEKIIQIRKEFGKEAVRDVTTFQFRQPRQFSPFGAFDQSSNERANKAALDYAKQRGYVTAQEKKAADDVTQAKQAQAALDATSYQLITAQVQGHKRAALELRQQQVEQQLAVDKLSASPEQLAAITRKANTELHQIREELAALPVKGSLGYAAEQAEQLDRALKKAIVGTSEYNTLLQQQINTNTQLREASKTPTQRWAEEISAANRLADIEAEISIERQRREKNLGSAGVQALRIVEEVNRARRAEQAAQANLRTDPFNTSLQNAAREAAKAVELSAEKAKSDLIEGARAARDAVQGLTRSVQDSVSSLQELRNTSGTGLNKFLPAQLVQDRQETLATQLDPLVKEIAKRFNTVLTFSGTLEERNAQKLDLIRADRQETRLTEDITKGNEDLARATNDLNEINKGLLRVNDALATATQNLAEKDWNIYVSVPGAPQYTYAQPREGVYN